MMFHYATMSGWDTQNPYDIKLYQDIIKIRNLN